MTQLYDFYVSQYMKNINFLYNLYSILYMNHYAHYKINYYLFVFLFYDFHSVFHEYFYIMGIYYIYKKYNNKIHY